MQHGAEETRLQGAHEMGREASDALAPLLGELRAPLADLCWLQVQLNWEERNLLATQASLRNAVTVDPRPLTFWLNGARMLAYDMPEWRLAGMSAPTSEDFRRRVDQEQGGLALAWLDQAESQHPESPEILIERANIQLNRLHDVAAAAESYRRATEKPGTPPYAARLYAELLRRLGRKAEAHAWLVKLYPTLRGLEDGAEELVLARIWALEAELGWAEQDRYRPSG
jgi:hypothetical protein